MCGFKTGDRVIVQESQTRNPFAGTVVYTEKGYGNETWLYVRPDDFSVIISRGSSSSVYHLGYFGVMLSMSKVVFEEDIQNV